MKKSEKIDNFHLLFSMIVEDFRVTKTDMAAAMGRSGRGRTTMSAARNLYNMYKLKVSFPPRMSLKNYEGYEFRAFFCKKTGQRGIARTFFELYRKTIKQEIGLAMCLAGNHDFFIMTRKKDVDLESLGLEIEESSILYDPIFTIPQGWQYPVKECVYRFFRNDFSKGKLDRIHHGVLNWEELQWNIYQLMHRNLRTSFKYVARKTKVFSDSFKYNLYKKIIPCCTMAHYFFPKGYHSYNKIFMKVKSDYEASIIKALSSFPCTTYVYPLKESAVMIIFHEGVRDIFIFTKKLEEKGLVDELLLCVPLASSL